MRPRAGEEVLVDGVRINNRLYTATSPADTLPASMIETLEYFGLATELDAFSVQYVLTWAATHPEVIARLDGVTLNLSACTLVDGRFMNRLYHDARSLGLPPGKLGFEITETAAIQHLDLAADLIRDFHQIGCTFSLDDFGSGLSSFGYLHSLPVDEVKIDKSFVMNMMQDSQDVAIVRISAWICSIIVSPS